MKSGLPLILFFLGALAVKAQPDTAYFSVDSISIFADGEEDHIQEMRWLINGDSLKPGNKPLAIIPNPDKQDTILFRVHSKSKWDTLITNIKTAETWYFVYNTCCQYFNIMKIENGKLRMVSGSVSFYVTNTNKRALYGGGIYNETGELGSGNIFKDSVTVKPHCKSALLPNMHRIELFKCEVSDSANADGEFWCDGSDFNKKGESFKRIKTITKFMLLPLYQEPFRIYYDVKKDNLMIR